MFGRVYAIVDKRDPDVILYVGSTVQKLNIRWSLHKFDAKQKKSKVNVHLREHGTDHFEMKLLDERAFEDIKAMRIHEEHYRMLHGPPLNTRKCTRGDMTRQQYKKNHRAENLDTILAKEKQWRETNRDTRYA